MTKVDGQEFTNLIQKELMFIELQRPNIAVGGIVYYALILDGRAYAPFLNWVEIYNRDEFEIV